MDEQVEGKSRLRKRRTSPQTITPEQVETFFAELADSCNVVRSAGTSSGEIWLSYSGINGMLLRGQQKIRFDIGGIEQCSIGPAGFETAGIGKVYKVGGSQVVGPRKGGWAAATGTATRTSFDTSTVSLQQLAERVKALIDDLHETAGHGLIGS